MCLDITYRWVIKYLVFTFNLSLHSINNINNMLSKIATFIIRKRFYLSINGLFMNKELNLAHRYFKRCHNSFTLFSYHHRRNNSRLAEPMIIVYIF